MWLAKSAAPKSQGSFGCQFRPARVSWIEQYHSFFVGEFEYRDLPVCSPFGFFSLPPKGQEVLILDSQQRNLLVGAVTESSQLPHIQEGEVLVRANSGAFLHLKSDGSVSINGLVIGQDGNIVSV